jgi:hypothetical protein
MARKVVEEAAPKETPYVVERLNAARQLHDAGHWAVID